MPSQFSTYTNNFRIMIYQIRFDTYIQATSYLDYTKIQRTKAKYDLLLLEEHGDDYSHQQHLNILITILWNF